MRYVASGSVRGSANTWTDEHRAEARRLWAEEQLSWSQIAERVGCSKATVGAWLRQTAVAGNGDRPVAH